MCPYFYLLNARRDFFIDWQATHEYHSKHCMAWLITIWLYFPISCQDDKIENRYSPSPDLLAMSSHVTLQISISEMAHGMQFCRKVQKTDHHPKARLLTYVALFFKMTGLASMLSAAASDTQKLSCYISPTPPHYFIAVPEKAAPGPVKPISNSAPWVFLRALSTSQGSSSDKLLAQEQSFLTWASGLTAKLRE